jgi:lipopolysaccharide heptosyltransferase II
VRTEGYPFDRNRIKRILIRAVNWLGDAVMTTPAIVAVRSSFPDARITLLANPLVAELFTPHDAIDEVMVYDKKGRHSGIGGRLRLAGELRAGRFDLAILLQNAFDAAFITRLAGIPLRMGYRTDGRGLLLSHGCPVKRENKRLHHVEYYLHMLAHFGITADTHSLSLTVAEEEERKAAQMLLDAGIGRDVFLLGINPGATYGSAKRWYPERFAAVADELCRQWGAKAVITGSTGEKGIAGGIAVAMKSPCLNMAGETSVRDLMALIKRCDFFVTNDSGPMHIAAALGVPLVAVFGPTDHSTTSPFSDRAVVIRQETDCAPCLLRECPTDHRCMNEITAESVLEEAVRLRARLEAGRE